ncbi:MAG TPA: MFS transporter [Rhodopila sp.]|uniref:MFS transporter n=1 Tax=Rhodopila sp. TaxID=2480087 RepID=UPI002C19E4B4|nr:MFS transporter [Rhodopila sp.]HVY17647.1 MFS transporter [Rhodopila sp.]
MTADILVPTEDTSAAKALGPPAAAVFLGTLAIGLPMSVLPLFVHGVLSYGTTVVGIVVGAQSLITLLSRPHAGRFSDKAGPRKAMMFGLVACSVAGVAYAVASVLNRGGALAALLVGRGTLGIAESLLVTGALALGIRRAGPHRSGMVMVWVGLALFGSFGFGAPVGQVLYSALGLGALAALVFTTPLIGLVVGARMAPIAPLPHRHVPLKTVLRWVAPAGLSLALSAIGYAAIVSFLPLVIASRAWGSPGLALAAFAGGFILARLLCASWPDRLGHRRVAIGFLSLEAAGLVLLWLAPSEAATLLGAAMAGGGYSISFPALGIEAIQRVPPENRGVALGTWAAFLDFGLGVGAPLLGVVAGVAGLQAPFAVGVLGCVAAVGIMLSLGR